MQSTHTILQFFSHLEDLYRKAPNLCWSVKNINPIRISGSPACVLLSSVCSKEVKRLLALEAWSWYSENSRNLCAKIKKLQVAFCHLLFTSEQNVVFQGIIAWRATHEAQMCLEMFLGQCCSIYWKEKNPILEWAQLTKCSVLIT